MVSRRILFIIIALFIMLSARFSYATDTNLNINSVAQDNTIYTAASENTDNKISNEYQPATVSYTDAQDSSELSLSNMINIVLIAVGVVLILLAIAILIKIK